MASPEPVVIPEPEGPRLVQIRMAINRACEHIALHEVETTKANGRVKHHEHAKGDG